MGGTTLSLLIIERTDRIAREVDANTKRETWGGYEQYNSLTALPLCFNTQDKG